MPSAIRLAWIDYTVILVYFVFMLSVGFMLKNFMKTSTDFFLSGRSMPAWIAGLAFISANLGAQEVIGMAASGAKYGIATSHFYWVGAIPAMVFLALFMMPFYYATRVRSVPEYLKLRFDEKTRGLNAISFAAMTIFSSGVSMYAMGKLFNLLLGWDFDTSMIIAAVIVLIYIFLGGLSSAIYNEVLQFFLIVFGFIPLVYLGLRDVGGWHGLEVKLMKISMEGGYAPTALTQSWAFMGDPSKNPMGIEWFGLVMGLGFVLSFGYWCTDFLVVQRAMAAKSLIAAQRTPIIAAFPKMIFPFLVILPGMIALALGTGSAASVADRFASTQNTATYPVFNLVSGTVHEREHSAGAPVASSATASGSGIIPPKMDEKTGEPLLDERGRSILDYDLAIPMMLLHYFPSGLLGLGLTALLASFMSGMAGNVTAFNTVWTYDIYQSYIRKGCSDQHYLWMGRFATIFGIGLSIVAAYVATAFNNIMELLQLVFAFVNAPLFATFALGMFWKRSTGHGAFTGLIAGMIAAAVHHGLSLAEGAVVGVKGGYFGIVMMYPSELAQTFWTAIWAFVTCFAVTIVVSLLTRPRLDDELRGLVYSLTPKSQAAGGIWYQRPAVLGVIALACALVLNMIFF